MTHRLGGELLAECLGALGAEVVFGLPGIHALGAWEGLRRRGLRSAVFRTELSATFAADGFARVSGCPAVVLLSTGPGALNSLTGLMEAASSHVPVVAVVSQIPRDLAGRRRGYLHELEDQLSSFRPVVKWAVSVPSLEALPGLAAEAWRRAASPPSGPTVLEVPVDLLTAPCEVPEVRELDGSPSPAPPASRFILDRVAELLRQAERPVIWAGGGVLRSGAWQELRALAERIGAPVATTYMGRGAIPAGHALDAGSGCDEGAFRDLLEGADVLVCVGTELGAETTRQYGLRFSGTVVQIDVAPERLGATYHVLGVVGDARAVLEALVERVPAEPGAWGPRAVQDVRRRISAGLDAQPRALERGLLASIGSALPQDAVQAWDMTILGYWAAAHQPAPAPRRFLYPLGSGTLGYAWPAALGACLALPSVPALAVVGDGGIAYGLAELVSARQHKLGAALLVIDDGGYGILKEYQLASFGETHEVDLLQPDLVALAGAAGVPARQTSPESLEKDLDWAISVVGPAVVVLQERLASALPTP
ncbi:MAG TPA: thiamine pyrophosphate-binding protein [Acidimicrobiales bacterium]|nr:thiamine pyrophosphate-binding protein [Acidimicrobiales bacterium]